MARVTKRGWVYGELVEGYVAGAAVFDKRVRARVCSDLNLEDGYVWGWLAGEENIGKGTVTIFVPEVDDPRCK